MATQNQSPEANKDIINLLNEAMDQIQQEKGSFETLGRKLSDQEQHQVDHMNEALSHLKKAQEEVYIAFSGGRDIKTRKAA